jgi:hypothetical protein
LSDSSNVKALTSRLLMFKVRKGKIISSYVCVGITFTNFGTSILIVIDTPLSSLMDSTTSPKVKTTKGEGVGAP